MSIVKRGSIESVGSASSEVYICEDCGHTEMPSKKTNKCPKCNGKMKKITSN